MHVQPHVVISLRPVSLQAARGCFKSVYSKLAPRGSDKWTNDPVQQISLAKMGRCHSGDVVLTSAVDDYASDPLRAPHKRNPERFH